MQVTFFGVNNFLFNIIEIPELVIVQGIGGSLFYFLKFFLNLNLYIVFRFIHMLTFSYDRLLSRGMLLAFGIEKDSPQVPTDGFTSCLESESAALLLLPDAVFSGFILLSAASVRSISASFHA